MKIFELTLMGVLVLGEIAFFVFAKTSQEQPDAHQIEMLILPKMKIGCMD